VSDARRRLGAEGEEAAAGWYTEQGYEVLARNWRVREGEIDLVLAGEGTLVFCEVKTRSSDRFGSGLEAVTAAKQRRLRRLAGIYLSRGDTGCVPRRTIRFDVAAVGPTGVDVVENAF